MQNNNAVFKNAWPYQNDKMNLPVNDVDAALSFYETVMGFLVVSKETDPVKKVVLGRDEVEIALAENGGDPTQDGCFFEVDDVEIAFRELKSNGLQRNDPDFTTERNGDVNWKVFFIIAPDGLCYCIGERSDVGIQNSESLLSGEK